MAFWSGEKILNNQSIISDFNAQQIDTNAYTLQMGNCCFVTGKDGDNTKVNLDPREAFSIPPGQFAYLMSRETLRIPANIMAFISMRTGIKFQGLINVSGFHVDPGYEGKLIFAAFNAGPSSIHISEGDRIFKIWFAELDRTSADDHLFNGTGNKEISNQLIHGMSKEIYSLHAITEKIQQLEFEVDRKFTEQKPTIDNLTFVWRAIMLGVIISIIVALFALAWPALQTGAKFLQQTDFKEKNAGQNVAPEN